MPRPKIRTYTPEQVLLVEKIEQELLANGLFLKRTLESFSSFVTQEGIYLSRFPIKKYPQGYEIGVLVHEYVHFLQDLHGWYRDLEAFYVIYLQDCDGNAADIYYADDYVLRLSAEKVAEFEWLTEEYTLRLLGDLLPPDTKERYVIDANIYIAKLLAKGLTGPSGKFSQVAAQAEIERLGGVDKLLPLTDLKTVCDAGLSGARFMC